MGTQHCFVRGSSQRLIVALLVLIGLVGMALPAPLVATQQADEGAALELPAMALIPADLAEAGMPDYVLQAAQSAQSYSLAGVAGDWTDQITNDDIRLALEDMGLLRAYEFGLRLRQDPADIRSDLARDLYGSLHAFNDTSGASESLAFIASLQTADPTIQRVEGSGAVPGAVLVRTILEDPNQFL